MEIDKYIQTLLYDYDCVIMPQLGGFVTNYRPASTDSNTGICHPPGKDIRFNKNLTKSDGLLERAVADGAKISFEDAGAVLKEITEKYWSQLNGGEKVKFKRIGVLYVDDHKNLRFEPATNENYLKASFGFESFSLPAAKVFEPKPIVKETDTPVIRFEKEEPETESRPFRSSKSIYWVAAATMLPFVAMSLYMGLSTNFKSPKEITLAELVPFRYNSNEAPVYHGRTSSAEAKPVENKIDGSGFPKNTTVFPFSFEKNEVDSTGVWINMKKVELNTPKEVKITGKYHIIAGCFGEEANAENYVSRLKSRGYSASILDFHKNLHRVKIESFQDYSTALENLQAMRADGTFPNAWLLKKPQF